MPYCSSPARLTLDLIQHIQRHRNTTPRASRLRLGRICVLDRSTSVPPRSTFPDLCTCPYSFAGTALHPESHTRGRTRPPYAIYVQPLLQQCRETMVSTLDPSPNTSSILSIVALRYDQRPSQLHTPKCTSTSWSHCSLVLVRAFRGLEALSTSFIQSSGSQIKRAYIPLDPGCS